MKIHYSSHGISVDPNEACNTPAVQAVSAKINALWNEYTRPIKLPAKSQPDPCVSDLVGIEDRVKALEVKRRS